MSINWNIESIAVECRFGSLKSPDNSSSSHFLGIYPKMSEEFSNDDDYYDDDDDGPTLKQVLSRACKQIDLGAAVMPKPLLLPDVDEHEDEIDGKDHEAGGVLKGRKVAPVEPTRYARVLCQEFNAVVVEHHLKWAPLCVREYWFNRKPCGEQIPYFLWLLVGGSAILLQSVGISRANLGLFLFLSLDLRTWSACRFETVRSTWEVRFPSCRFHSGLGTGK